MQIPSWKLFSLFSKNRFRIFYSYCFCTRFSFNCSIVSFSCMWCHNYPFLKMERVEGIEPSHGLWKSPRLPLHHTRFKMAEREGFEPSVAFKDHNSLANCLFRPLRHLSIKSLTISDFFTGRYYQSSAPLSSGVVLKWRLMSVLPGPSSFNEPSFQD